MTQTEALKLALEALEKLTGAAEGFSVSGVYFNEELWARKCLDDAYDAMGFAQEALAQPAVSETHKQEPVEWYSVEGETRSYGVGMVECAYAIGRDEVVHVVTHESVKDVAMKHLPTHRTWVGLTDDEFEDIEFGCRSTPFGKIEAMRMVEAKLKDKNI